MHNILPYVCVVLLDFSRELTALNFSYIIYTIYNIHNIYLVVHVIIIDIISTDNYFDKKKTTLKKINGVCHYKIP